MLAVLLIIFAYLLFGLLPLFVKGLNAEGLGAFSITFFRFFYSAIIELTIAVVALRILYGNLQRRGIIKKESFRSVLWNVLKKYFLTPNDEFLGGKSQTLYLITLGILVAVGTNVFYILSFALVGVAFSTIIINGLVFLSIALINIIKKEESIDILKAMYFTFMIGAIVTITFSRNGSIEVNLNPFSAIIMGFAIISFIAFSVGLSKDKSVQRVPLFKDLRLSLLPDADKEQNSALLVKAMLKNFAIHISRALFLLPFSFIWIYLTPDHIMGQLANEFIFRDLSRLGTYLVNPYLILLILIGTIAPYALLNVSTMIWPKGKYGRNDMWISIVKMLQPLMGLYIGYFTWHENIRGDYIVFTTIFLIATIIIRYFHVASNLQHAVFVLRLAHNVPDKNKRALDFLMSMRDVDEINFLLGSFDVIVHVTTKSTQRLSEINNRIKNCPYFSFTSYSVAKELDVRRITPKKMRDFVREEFTNDE